MSEKERLIRELREAGTELVSALRAVPAESFEAVRSPEGWKGRDFIAHIAATDLVVSPRLIEMARHQADASVPEPAPIPGFPHEWNEREVAARRDRPVSDVIDEVERNRAGLIATIESSDDDLFDLWLPGRRDSAAGIIKMLSGQHVRQHARQALGETLPGPAA